MDTENNVHSVAVSSITMAAVSIHQYFQERFCHLKKAEYQ